MRRRLATILGSMLILVAGLWLGGARASGDPAVVQAVLFWMETCPYCHEVIDHVLPPIKEEYGPSLDMRLVEIETAEEWGYMVAAAQDAGLPREHVGVPLLLVADEALIGGGSIAYDLPRIVAASLAEGGRPLPDRPGLAELMPKGVPFMEDAGVRFDLPWLPIGVLVVLLAAVGVVIWRAQVPARRSSAAKRAARPRSSQPAPEEPADSRKSLASPSARKGTRRKQSRRR